MDVKEYAQAAASLIDWLESQEIDPDDSVPILTMVLVGVIAGVAKRTGRNAKAGGRVVARMITEAFNDQP